MERNRDLQDYIDQLAWQNAEKWFNLKKIVSQPTVVVDITVDEFWVTAQKSSKNPEIISKIADGSIIPINAQILGQITQTQAIWHACLYEDGRIPIIPTYINLSISPDSLAATLVKNEYNALVIPNIYIRKQSMDDRGTNTSHGGAGISIVKTGFLGVKPHLPRVATEFLQPFIMPPIENDGTAFVRDIRVFMVGEEPVAGIIRRAKLPLSKDNLSGKLVPSIEQIYSARERGPREHLDGVLKTRVFEQAKKVREILESKVKERIDLFSPISPIGFMSLDFLIDANNELLPVDCDVQPWVDTFEDTNLLVARKLAEYASGLANQEGREKQVFINGPKDEPFIRALYDETKRLVGKKRTVYQESLMSRAINFLKSQAKNL